MKVYTGNRGTAPIILNLSNGWILVTKYFSYFHEIQQAGSHIMLLTCIQVVLKSWPSKGVPVLNSGPDQEGIWGVGVQIHTFLKLGTRWR
jgi:hypothetical protein